MSHAAEDGSQHFLRAFSDPQAVAHYTDGPKRFVPGLDGLHRMTGLLLAEAVPDDATILVLGAGGGLELRAMAEAHPGWRFVGVDPAPAMLDVARRTLGPLTARVKLVEGYIDDAPDGPFDGATCLLTLHFLQPEERQRTVAAIRRRLKPNAPFVAAHGSFPQDRGERSIWLSRYEAFAMSSGADEEMARKARTAVESSVAMLDPAADEAILRAGGFPDASLFYAAFMFRGWIGHAG
ncbi:class I SAM-dependent methyltransferase [Mangrovicella endophytica]|uniref:class I SAM-dependent methyltransferase n=1 Tax=Mangrovicella endophytica TaxID=2066697 RepID=UPI000C9E6B4D|nr:class I SAM-dependent methyltransferase [Mangrovicella endophytica]